MKSFLETLAQRKYDLASEINAIEDLFKRDGYRSIRSLFAGKFLSWPLRNNYVDLDCFLSNTGLEAIIRKADRGTNITIDEYIFYAEYALNVLLYFRRIRSLDAIRPAIENIKNVLNQLNYKIHSDENQNARIIPNDVLISEAAEIAQDTYGLGESIYAYNYRQLSGDLNAKSDILCRLYKYYETIENQAKQYGFNTLAEDVSHLSNKLNVRHAASPKQQIVLGDMTQKEIEEWYDELFRLYLSLIVLVDYKSKRKDINELKAKLG